MVVSASLASLNPLNVFAVLKLHASLASLYPCKGPRSNTNILMFLYPWE